MIPRVLVWAATWMELPLTDTGGTERDGGILELTLVPFNLGGLGDVEGRCQVGRRVYVWLWCLGERSRLEM